jgi:hypothetical protein
VKRFSFRFLLSLFPGFLIEQSFLLVVGAAFGEDFAFPQEFEECVLTDGAGLPGFDDGFEICGGGSVLRRLVVRCGGAFCLIRNAGTHNKGAKCAKGKRLLSRRGSGFWPAIASVNPAIANG